MQGEASVVHPGLVDLGGVVDDDRAGQVEDLAHGDRLSRSAAGSPRTSACPGIGKMPCGHDGP
ncbi:hypothetical protein [Georgenia sp. SUBG003]|uniref:hypothetical protein n=1 Tax=Georgenia sp. SUBG003 TaxID=1497974 RepID=UPI003AB308DE